MRDLYKHLKITDSASQKEIEKAISSIKNPSLSKDASYVLLDTSKKRVFDRSNRTLRRIGRLRASLGFSDGANWKAQSVNDYTYSPSKNESIYDSVLGKSSKTKDQEKQSNTQKESHKSGNNYESIIKTGVVYAIIIGLIMIVVSISNEEEQVSSLDHSATSSNFDYNASAGSDNSNGDENSESDPLFSDSELDKLMNGTDEENKFDEPLVPLPANGAVKNYTDKVTIAPFEIKTPAISQEHYLVKLEDYNTGKTKAMIFVHAGQSVESDVPLGIYRVKYATGENWYGMEHLFGPGSLTQRFEADDIFRFERSGGQVSGYTVELIPQQFGNLETRNVSEEEW